MTSEYNKIECEGIVGGEGETGVAGGASAAGDGNASGASAGEEVPVAAGEGAGVAGSAGEGVAGAAVIAGEQAAAPTGMSPNPNCKLPGVGGRKPSIAWSGFFPPVMHENGTKTTTCMHCPQTYVCGSSIYGNSNMLTHFKTCMKNPANIVIDKQKKLTFTSGSNLVIVDAWKFDQSACREWLGKMLIIDELPLRFVESEGFRMFMSICCPDFQIPSRITMNRDVYAIYKTEKQNLKAYFSTKSPRLSLTTDTWTSNQQINYMCLTVHYIDENWVFQKKILKMRAAVRFVKQSPSRLSRFKECVVAAGIDSKALLCLDVPTRWNSTYLMLKAACKLEEAFDRYDGEDPLLRIELDTTYLMLKAACKLEEAFDRYDGEDPLLRIELDTKVKKPGNVPIGMLCDDDWCNVKRLVTFLEHFYHLTCIVSGSTYITSNLFLNAISDTKSVIQTGQMDCDFEMVDMADK